MEILLKIRIAIWVLMLCLWGVIVYQFLGEDEAPQRVATMQYVNNPYKGLPLPTPAPEAQGPAPIQPPSTPPPAEPISSLDYVRPLEPADTAQPRVRTHYKRMRREGKVTQELPVPPGFIKTLTRHFTIYSETDPPSDEFIKLLENLHGNLMLDLAAFSPWATDEKVSIFLFKNQDTYRELTGRPAWSGGASSVPKRKVFVYESEELPGILAHELCHIYYDGFFLDGKQDPLWLSEGLATLVQVERGLAAPVWLRENMDILERGGGYPLGELTSVTSTAGSSDDNVRLWYAQSYSLVRFLLRSQYRSSFYKFSENLREGRDITQSLYRSYGMPFNRLKALEYAWRYQLASSSMNRQAANEH